jgi:hypothetical protein
MVQILYLHPSLRQVADEVLLRPALTPAVMVVQVEVVQIILV